MSSSEYSKNNLKELRVDKGLSIEEVAEKLRLSIDVIKKLESSQFSELGAFTYVRGYLNHYAKILGVSAEPYIELVPKLEVNIPLVNTSHNMTKGIKLKRRSKSVMSYTLGTFILIAVSVSGWFVLKNYMGSSTPQHEIKIVDSNNLKITPKNNMPIDQNNSITQDDNYHYSSIIPRLDKPSNKNLPIKDLEQESQPGLNEDKKLVEIPQQETEDAQQKPLSYTITVTATQASWVEIEDSAGNKLHNDLLQPGTIVLQSEQPVHFRIGNQDNVEVKINDEKVELSKFSKKNIADFSWPVEG